MKTNTVLPDTSLCAIVRDEMMNPAGGIIDFVESTMLFVEEGVIVDTGSIDGTREVLEEMARKYTNLHIVDHLFDGYGRSRNVSLDNCKTKYALILDADERLFCDDFNLLRLAMMTNKEVSGFELKFMNIFPDKERPAAGGLNPRIIRKSKKFRYNQNADEKEYLLFKGEWYYSDAKFHKFPKINVWIKHFLPSLAGRSKKNIEWYDKVFTNISIMPQFSPSEADSFNEWKKYNPRREEYK